jgi:hypothetical protein
MAIRLYLQPELPSDVMDGVDLHRLDTSNTAPRR